MSTIMPQQDPEKYERQRYDLKPQGGGGRGGARILLGLLMVGGGVALSLANTGRVFYGLVVVGVITLIKGIANAAR